MAPRFDQTMPVNGRLTALEGAVTELRRWLAENPTRGRDGAPGQSITGEKGERGERGHDGTNGKDSTAPGSRGEKGEHGERGERGERGLTGNDGVSNVAGPQGAPGQSIKGDKGERGESVDVINKYSVSDKIIALQNFLTEQAREVKALGVLARDTAEKIKLLTTAFETSSNKNKDYITFLLERAAQRSKNHQT